MRPRLISILVLPLALILASAAFAVDSVHLSITDVEEQPGTMTVSAQVVDGSGRQSTLTARDFDVFLGRQRLDVRGVEQVATDRQPAHVVLLVDVSGSMAGDPIAQARASLREFVSMLEPDDRVALIAFSTEVNLIQDFTADRGLIDQAIGQLEAFGDTALYDAVIEAVRLAEMAPPAGRLVVLLSDGVAMGGTQSRESSLAAPPAAGVGVSVVGLGDELDVPYLRDLTEAGEGVYAEAPTPAELQVAFRAMTASVMRPFSAEYRLDVEVSDYINRMEGGELRVQARVRTEMLSETVTIGPLEGALPPPFELQVRGLPEGESLNSTATLRAQASDGRTLTEASFYLDGGLLAPAAGNPLAVVVDPAELAEGTYSLRVTASDAAGREAEASIPIVILAPPVAAEPGAGLPVLPIAAVALLLLVALLVFRFIKGRLDRDTGYITQPVPAPVSLDAGSRQERRAAAVPPASVAPATAAAPAPDVVQGRLVVINEDALRTGQLDSVREYDLGTLPLLVGTGTTADVRLEDEFGRIAAEEARVWVQRGRLAYHKLTTLSAMATEGLTSNWTFLEDGEEVRLGQYRLVFQLAEPDIADAADQVDGPGDLAEHDSAYGWSAQAASASPPGLTAFVRQQEHGMALERNTDEDDPSLQA